VTPDDHDQGIDFDALKRRPLEQIAAAWGYVRDTGKSTRRNPVLRAPGQPKLVTRRCDNGHWVYFNTTDPDDNGTVIDFMLARGLSFADIRTRFGTADTHQPTSRSTPGQNVIRLWNRAQPDPKPDWLIARGIRPKTLETYQPLTRRNSKGHVLFAHRNQHRVITGFEIGPPDGPRRFATGGTRSLFALCVAPAHELQALVITECAVDALSLAQIEGCPVHHAFLSTAGDPSARQCQQISLAARVLPNIKTVILAHDHDTAGERQADTLRKKVHIPSHVMFHRHRPPENLDWNDVVMNTAAEETPA